MYLSDTPCTSQLLALNLQHIIQLFEASDGVFVSSADDSVICLWLRDYVCRAHMPYILYIQLLVVGAGLELRQPKPQLCLNFCRALLSAGPAELQSSRACFVLVSSWLQGPNTQHYPHLVYAFVLRFFTAPTTFSPRQVYRSNSPTLSDSNLHNHANQFCVCCSFYLLPTLSRPLRYPCTHPALSVLLLIRHRNLNLVTKVI